jgi:hypothetical protein
VKLVQIKEGYRFGRTVRGEGGPTVVGGVTSTLDLNKVRNLFHLEEYPPLKYHNRTEVYMCRTISQAGNSTEGQMRQKKEMKEER